MQNEVSFSQPYFDQRLPQSSNTSLKTASLSYSLQHQNVDLDELKKELPQFESDEKMKKNLHPLSILLCGRYTDPTRFY